MGIDRNLAVVGMTMAPGRIEPPVNKPKCGLVRGSKTMPLGGVVPRHVDAAQLWRNRGNRRIHGQRKRILYIVSEDGGAVGLTPRPHQVSSQSGVDLIQRSSQQAGPAIGFGVAVTVA